MYALCKFSKIKLAKMEKFQFSWKHSFPFAVISTAFVLLLPPAFGKDLKVFYNCTLPNQYALTFDDGPHPTGTAEVLDLLKELNVTATFFIQGFGVWETNLTRYQESVSRTFREGHQIGNHAWSHPDMRNITEEQIRRELKDMDNLIKAIIGVRPTIFRPPYGEYNERLVRIAKEDFNYEVIMWNIDTWDWSHPGDTDAGMGEYYAAINSTLHPNYIALHHDVQAGAVDLGATAIQFMKENGFHLVSVADCIGIPKYQ